MIQLDKIVDSIKQHMLKNHREMIVLVGTSDDKLIRFTHVILRAFRGCWTREEAQTLRGVYMYQHDSPESSRRMEMARRVFKDSRIEDLEIDFRPYKDTDKLLGLTLDFAILDLINSLRPNDVGRLSGVVRGGGIYVLYVYPIDVWTKTLTKFQESLLVPQYGPQHVRHLLKIRFWNKMMQHDDVVLIDVDRETFIREPVIAEMHEKRKTVEIKIPKRTRFPQELYKLAKTQDQVNVLRIAEKLIDRPERGKRVNFVLIADRGRGKSAALGLSLAGLCHKIRRAKGFVRCAVTAANPQNVQVLMEFLVRGLRELGYEPVVEHDEHDVIRTVRVGSSMFIDYYRPYSLISATDVDIVVVDEAAMIPLPLLYKIHSKFSRVIYASTIHGYEGAGRGFSIRFLKYLREQKDTIVVEYEMSEPIRYAENDPVERWVFDTLLLDAEPARVDPDDLERTKSVESLQYLKPDLRRFCLEEEDLLRQFVGIYVQAHYRNEPDDMGMMMDAPHHFIRGLTLEGKKVLVAVELAEEGGLDESTIGLVLKGYKLPGNIIPDRLIKYWKLTEFAKLKGWRIVRIATHPELQGRGLGTYTLKLIEDEAKEKGIDWIGVGFGAHEMLLRFWIRSGFMPVHMSPERNPVSGEYSVLLIKPISENARELVERVNREFRVRLISSLHGPYHDLEPEIAALLLTDWGIGVDDNYVPSLTEGQMNRLIAYAWGPMTYENAVDALFELFRAYFYRSSRKRVKLSHEYELMMIAKTLQARTWRDAANVCNVRKVTLMLSLREIAKLLIHYFFGDKVEIPLYAVGVTKARASS